MDNSRNAKDLNGGLFRAPPIGPIFLEVRRIGPVHNIEAKTMAKKITLNMITQRSVEEGVGIVSGKMSPEYFEACSIIEMHDDDVQALGLFPNQLVKVTSECGSVIVKSVKGRQTLYPGLAFIPQGVYANQIVPPRTQATGEPQYSGFPVTVEPAPLGEKRKSTLELVQGAVGLWRGD